MQYGADSTIKMTSSQNYLADSVRWSTSYSDLKWRFDIQFVDSEIVTQYVSIWVAETNWSSTGLGFGVRIFGSAVRLARPQQTIMTSPMPFTANQKISFILIKRYTYNYLELLQDDNIITRTRYTPIQTLGTKFILHAFPRYNSGTGTKTVRFRGSLETE